MKLVKYFKKTVQKYIDEILSPGAWANLSVEEVASILVLLYGVMADRVLPPVSYVPSNIAAGAFAVSVANRRGASMNDMGLERSNLMEGLRLGLSSCVPLAAMVGTAVAIPWTRQFFLDDNVVNVSTGRAFLEALVRIPLGTALGEELIFRGAILGMFLRKRRPVISVLLSSALFGLWHVSPTLKSCSTNPAYERATALGIGATVGIVSAAVSATTTAGVVLGWLRLKSGSIITPVIAHAFLNASAFFGGRIAMRINNP